MLNLSNIKKQVLSLAVLEAVAFAGMSALPSFAHQSKAEKAAAQQVSEDRLAGQKLALVEGSVAVHQAPVAVEEAPAIKRPLTLKQVESYNIDFGGFGGGSL